MTFQLLFKVRKSGENFTTRKIDQCEAHGIVLVNGDENCQEFFSKVLIVRFKGCSSVEGRSCIYR